MSLRRRKPALPLLREAFRSAQAFPPYFSIDDVAEWLEERGAEVGRHTLRDYLSDLLRDGLLNDAGRGWYCRHGERPVLDDSEVRPLLDEVAAAFPLLEASAWSTSMLNPWLHHLIGTGSKFLHVERDALEPVAGHLETTGWKVFANPASTSSSRVSTAENTVILRPLHVHAPVADELDLLPERILVELRIEVDRLNIMDLTEYHDLAFRLANETRLIMGSLVRYLSKRKLSVHDLFENRLTALFSKKAIDRLLGSK